MYPTILKVVVSTNSSDRPVFTVSISQRLVGERERSKVFTAYSIFSMLERLHASRSWINELTAREQVCYPAGETNTWDDVIEQLNLLGFMCKVCGDPFELRFKELWGSFPYHASDETMHLVRGFLSQPVKG